MIDAQDSLVTQISANVNDVEANTQNATSQLQGAIKSAKSARRKRWCLICFFFILLLAVGLYCLFQYYLIPQVFNPQQNNTSSTGGQAKTGKMISGVPTDETGTSL
jgi:t-SNARE complex subunit (syntaxin)